MIKSCRIALIAAALGAATSVSLAGCAAKDDTKAESLSGGAAPIAVAATDSACTLSASQTRKGKQAFVITNSGAKVTEFYVYDKDNAVLAEAENISPGLQRTLDVDLPDAGTYRTACKPGMVGDGISAALTVTG